MSIRIDLTEEQFGKLFQMCIDERDYFRRIIDDNPNSTGAIEQLGIMDDLLEKMYESEARKHDQAKQFTSEQKKIILEALYNFRQDARVHLLSAASRPFYWEDKLQKIADAENIIEAMEVEDASEN